MRMKLVKTLSESAHWDVTFEDGQVKFAVEIRPGVRIAMFLPPDSARAMAARILEVVPE